MVSLGGQFKSAASRLRLAAPDPPGPASASRRRPSPPEAAAFRATHLNGISVIYLPLAGPIVPLAARNCFPPPTHFSASAGPPWRPNSSPASSAVAARCRYQTAVMGPIRDLPRRLFRRRIESISQLISARVWLASKSIPKRGFRAPPPPSPPGVVVLPARMTRR